MNRKTMIGVSLLLLGALATPSYALGAPDFESEAAGAVAEFAGRARALGAVCGPSAAATQRLPCPKAPAAVRASSSDWVFLGETSSFFTCRDAARGLGFKYFWAQPILSRTGGFRCYAGTSLWPFD